MSFFQTFTSEDMAGLINRAERTICYAGPGIRLSVAEALVSAADRIGPELVTVCLDFDERVLRMGFGDLEAVKLLTGAQINVTTTPGLRMGLLVVDDQGFSFAPTALYLEADDRATQGMNAMRLSTPQVTEALARLSPAAKAVAVAMAKTDDERERLLAIVVEVPSAPIADEAVRNVEESLAAAPLADFDVARQVRVYNARLQYVEVELKNTAIERRRITIPESIQKLGGADELKGRLRTTFDLIGKTDKLSSKPLADKVAQLRNDFTPSLGPKFGRAILKSTKVDFERRVNELKAELVEYQEAVESELQDHLDKSHHTIAEHYAPMVRINPPDAVRGRFGGKVEAWLDHELGRAFPKAEDLVGKMALELDFKDVTFETLQDETFLAAVRKAFPAGDWERAHDEYQAAGEKHS